MKRHIRVAIALAIAGLATLAAWRLVRGPADRSPHDPFGRLVVHPAKPAVPCPQQDEGTVVLLLVGQSNAGNHAARIVQTEQGERVLNFSRGKCHVAGSPLLGATGSLGEPWTRLGDNLVVSARARHVILVPAAVSGSRMRQWQAGGELNGMLQATLDDLRPHYRITHVLWHQGESDFLGGTSQADYTRQFLSMVDSLRRRGVDAPVFVSVASRCGPDPAWTPANPVAAAQRALVDPARGILSGIDTDRLLAETDRADGCHLSASGQEKVSSSWLDRLASDTRR